MNNLSYLRKAIGLICAVLSLSTFAKNTELLVRTENKQSEVIEFKNRMSDGFSVVPADIEAIYTYQVSAYKLELLKSSVLGYLAQTTSKVADSQYEQHTVVNKLPFEFSLTHPKRALGQLVVIEAAYYKTEKNAFYNLTLTESACSKVCEKVWLSIADDNQFSIAFESLHNEKSESTWLSDYDASKQMFYLMKVKGKYLNTDDVSEESQPVLDMPALDIDAIIKRKLDARQSAVGVLALHEVNFVFVHEATISSTNAVRFANSAISKTQRVLDNSGINIRLKNVGVVRAPSGCGATSDCPSWKTYYALRLDMERSSQYKRLKKQHNADFLIYLRDDYDTQGVHGSANISYKNTRENWWDSAEDAFAVIHAGCTYATPYLDQHEIGHLLGGHHDPDTARMGSHSPDYPAAGYIGVSEHTQGSVTHVDAYYSMMGYHSTAKKLGLDYANSHRLGWGFELPVQRYSSPDNISCTHGNPDTNCQIGAWNQFNAARIDSLRYYLPLFRHYIYGKKMPVAGIRMLSNDGEVGGKVCLDADASTDENSKFDMIQFDYKVYVDGKLEEFKTLRDYFQDFCHDIRKEGNYKIELKVTDMTGLHNTTDTRFTISRDSDEVYVDDGSYQRLCYKNGCEVRITFTLNKPEVSSGYFRIEEKNKPNNEVFKVNLSKRTDGTFFFKDPTSTNLNKYYIQVCNSTFSQCGPVSDPICGSKKGC